MLNKTHLAIGLFFMLFFLHKVTHVWTYVAVFAIATLLPNFSSFRFRIRGQNRNPVTRRGLMHSFTLCFIVTFLLAWFLPTMAFPFFLGYGVHLLADSWTVEGIKPFWPLKYESKGKLRRGGSVEHMIFYSFIAADIILVWFLFL